MRGRVMIFTLVIALGTLIGDSSSEDTLPIARLDAVAIHRTILSDATVAARFHRVGGPRIVGPLPEAMPDLPDVPEGRTLLTISEGMPSHDRWLNQGESWPPEFTRWLGEEFLLPRIPLRFDTWGIRESWKAPLLVRMVADVPLPPGQHRFLLRARGLSRLWVNGQVVARTKAVTASPPDGEERITPVAEPPLPGQRPRGYHQQESFANVSVGRTADESTSRVRVVLELVVGGKNQRTETGEVCVAVLTADGDSYVVLQPRDDRELPLTDAAIEPALSRIESLLARHDDLVRRTAAASQDVFWNRRHLAARAWANEHPAPRTPRYSDHPIDGFVTAKIKRALRASAFSNVEEAAHFHGQILPILRKHCFRCHGEKDAGGLKLNTREFALKGGDSEMPAIVPGDPAASELIVRIREEDEDLRMPPTESGLDPDEIAALEKWVATEAPWPAPPITAAAVALAPLVTDEVFLRRIYLDTVGIPPTEQETQAFFANHSPSKRQHLIDQLLQDERIADHWISLWLDLLAENPTLLNASLNSTGPFRWYLFDSLRDNKSLDRMVTELILMRGSQHEGGSAGFGIAAENDAPYAAKGHIVASAFLGIELQCARCHDSPYHSTTQRDLYSLAAMFERKPVTVPKTSRVPTAFFEAQARESLIRVTLKPDELVAAQWPFAEVTGIEDNADIDCLMHRPDDARERLATLITAPSNLRFPRVIVNRIWKRLMGAGLVEPAHDWEGRVPSHPELLDWLAHQLVSHDYDARHVLRLIVTSQTYQRQARGQNLNASAERRFFNAPEPRRLTAEQIVDSLHVVTGMKMEVEELTFVHDGRRPMSKRLTLGRPTRAWMFASLNNERDRPSLSLPRARAVADVLEAFGWTGSRQKPIHERDTESNVLQPGVLANSTLSMILTRAADGSALAQLAIDSDSPAELTDSLFLRILTRKPNGDERASFTAALAGGFETRIRSAAEISIPAEPPPLPLVTWFNHLRPEATTIQNEMERRVRQGPRPDGRLRPVWRETYEDVVWSLINHREFAWLP